MPEEIDIFTSRLVPKHELMPEDEKIALLERLCIKAKQLPKIRQEDAASKALGAKRGDVMKITRNSLTAGEYCYYRIVV